MDYIKWILFYTLYKNVKVTILTSSHTQNWKPDQQLQAMQADWTPEGLTQLKHLHRREETYKGDSSL